MGLPSLASICQTRSLGPGPSFLTAHICFLVSPGPGGPRLWPGGSLGSLGWFADGFILFELAFCSFAGCGLRPPVVRTPPRSRLPCRAWGRLLPLLEMENFFSVCWLGPPGCPGAKWHSAARLLSEMWSGPNRRAFLLPTLVIYFPLRKADGQLADFRGHFVSRSMARKELKHASLHCAVVEWHSDAMPKGKTQLTP